MYIGIHAYGRKPIKEAVSHGLGNFIWIPKWGYPLSSPAGYDFPDGGWAPGSTDGYSPDAKSNPALAESLLASVREAVAHGLYFMISGRRGLGDEVRPGGFGLGGDCSGDFIPPELLARIRDEAGPLFLGVHLEELDCDYLQNSLAPSYVARSPWLYDYGNRREARLALEGHLRALVERYRSWGTAALPNMCVTFHHYAFRAGAEFILAEPMEHCVSTQVQLAYLRGAGVQYGKPWGVWVSPWFWGRVPTDDKELWPSPYAARFGGHSASGFRRCLYAAFYSGAQMLTHQETEPIFIRGAEPERWELGSWGREMQAFVRHVEEDGEAGEPCVDVALLLDEDNGWAPGGLWQSWDCREQGQSPDTIWAKWPLNFLDKMIPVHLDYFYPDFGRSGTAYIRRKKDEYPGYFCATPLGPADVLLTDCPLACLQRYRVLIALGPLNITPGLAERLIRFVENGGWLIMNAEQLWGAMESKAALQDLFGVSLMDEQAVDHVIKAVPQSVLKMRACTVPDRRLFIENTFRYRRAQILNATTIGTFRDGSPAAAVAAHGRGRAILTFYTYADESGVSQRTLSFERRLIERVVASLQKIVIFPGSDMEWMLTREKEGSYRLLLINHGLREWRGGVVLRDLPQLQHVNSSTRNQSWPLHHRGRRTHIHCSVPAQGVEVLRMTDE